jgi:D-threo-aldose 1-dehydrogenase|tara:strand:+ start:2462 stop:3469 length:1008 start_codon:yes stop_codon:yes gene_type:complete
MKQNCIGNTRLQLSELGFGAASLGNLYRQMSTQLAAEVVEAAWASGMRYFDTAPFYGLGLSERRLGDVLRDMPRDDFVLSTKVGRLLKPGTAADKFGFCSPMPFDPVFDYSYDGIMRSFEDSLQRLGLAHIDILYMHDIGSLTHGDEHERLFKTAMEGGYRAMDELRSAGLISAIGLGVNEFEVCDEAMQYGDFDCFLLAGRYTLLEHQASLPFLEKCLARNISIILGGAYNSGILATGTQGSTIAHYNYEPASADIIAKVKAMENVCADFGLDLPATALQFALAHPAIINVIPGLNSAKRVRQTMGYLDVDIPIAFWGALKDQHLIEAAALTPE